MKGYIYLMCAIFFEIIGTTMLKLSNGFSNLLPSVGVVVFFGLSFTLIVFALKTVPLSLGYSIWSGVGTAGAGIIGVLLFNEVLSGINMLGLVIIIAGVVIMNTSENESAA
jgi:multidrug resistance protein EbrB